MVRCLVFFEQWPVGPISRLHPSSTLVDGSWVEHFVDTSSMSDCFKTDVQMLRKLNRGQMLLHASAVLEMHACLH
jgi:hypothetical protein